MKTWDPYQPNDGLAASPETRRTDETPDRPGRLPDRQRADALRGLKKPAGGKSRSQAARAFV